MKKVANRWCSDFHPEIVTGKLYEIMDADSKSEMSREKTNIIIMNTLTTLSIDILDQLKAHEMLLVNGGSAVDTDAVNNGDGVCYGGPNNGNGTCYDIIKTE